MAILATGTHRRYARWLWALAALFVVRVVAQPLALVVDSPVLPPFDAWHSGVLPYGLLLASQAAIIAVLCRSAWRMSRGAVVPSRRAGAWLLGLGGVYFGGMIVRLALGLTVFTGDSWFARPLPTAFHLVLAGFMLVYGHFHVRADLSR